MKFKLLITLIGIMLVNPVFAKSNLLSIDCAGFDKSRTVYNIHLQFIKSGSHDRSIDYISWNDNQLPIANFEELADAMIAWTKNYIDVDGKTMKIGVAVENGKFYALNMNTVTHKMEGIIEIYCKRS